MRGKDCAFVTKPFFDLCEPELSGYLTVFLQFVLRVLVDLPQLQLVEGVVVARYELFAEAEVSLVVVSLDWEAFPPGKGGHWRVAPDGMQE